MTSRAERVVQFPIYWLPKIHDRQQPVDEGARFAETETRQRVDVVGALPLTLSYLHQVAACFASMDGAAHRGPHKDANDQ